jgi:predicted O-methyltransferase YrrM
MLRNISRIKSIKNVYRRVSTFFAALRLRKSVGRLRDINEIVDLAFSFKQFGVSITPLQVREELTRFVSIANTLKPRIVLEIGTAKGGTLLLLARVADPSATIISLDLPGGLFGGGYQKWRIPLYRSFVSDKQNIQLLRSDSHSVSTLRKVKTIIGEHGIDLLFIDGDHSYQGIKKDFRMYSPLVRTGGIVVLHDIVPHDVRHDPSGAIGVDRFWRELRNNYECCEIVKDRRQGWAGIGIVYV